MYGHFANEKLVGKAIEGRREEAVLVTKSSNVRGGRYDEANMRAVNL